MASSAALCLGALVLTSAGAPRVRRELRRLGSDEREDLWAALRTMKVFGRVDGKEKFGGSYEPYDYFTIKHAVSVLDSRGDQGHFGPCFMTYHRAALLEFEAALLSVLTSMNSSLDALPYWDATLDSDTGDFFHDPEHWIFGPRFLGSYTGNASENYVVTDGALPYWPVGVYDDAFVPREYLQSVRATYTGHPETGLLRGPSNLVTNKFCTRFAKKGFTELDAHNDIVYDEADANRCSDGRWVRDWMEWQDCVENARLRGRQTNSGALWNFASGLHWMHSQFHVKIGGYDELPPDFPFMDPSEQLIMGDFLDVATSPNDPFFAFHHANADRLNMEWQHSVLEWEPTIADRHWGYPASYAAWAAELEGRDAELDAAQIWHSAKEGCQLHDVISARFPFPKLEGLPVTPGGLTHADVLRAASPGSARYTYDTLATSHELLV